MSDTFKFDAGTSETVKGAVLIRAFVKDSPQHAHLLHRLGEVVRRGGAISDLENEFPQFRRIIQLLHLVVAQGKIDPDSVSSVWYDADYGSFIHFTLV